MTIKASSLVPVTDSQAFQSQVLLAWNPTTKKFEAIGKSAIPGSQPKWKKITTFQNGWSEQAPDVLGNLSYCLDSNGLVHIDGVIKGGATGTVAFTLDAGFRPSIMKNRYGTEQNGSRSGLVINTDGTVTVYASPNYAVGQFIVIETNFPLSKVFF